MARRVRAPALAFTELRTITDVVGRPPMSPATRLPVPCASNSRFGRETRRNGSSLSVASRLRSVSRLDTMASVAAATYILGLLNCVKSGKRKISPQPLPSAPSTGTDTMCELSIAHEEPRIRSASLTATPKSTAASGAGNRLFFRGLLFQATSKPKQSRPMRIEPGTN